MIIGIIGAGHWGRQYIRNFCEIPSVSKVCIFDYSEIQLNKMITKYSHYSRAYFYKEKSDFFNQNLDAVVVATNVTSHFHIAKFVLNLGIHCLVEKPMCMISKQVEELQALSIKNKLTLMTGHTLLYSPEVQHMQHLIQSGEAGRPLSAQCNRLNPGRYQEDCNVLWDLAPHDISVLLYLFNSRVCRVYCQASSQDQDQNEDVGSIQLEFQSGAIASLNFSWINAHKTRTINIGCENKEFLFDDNIQTDSLKVFQRQNGHSVPKLNNQESLKTLCLDFMESITHNISPIADVHQALDVVHILEAAHQSLRQAGAGVIINSSSDLNKKTAFH